MAKIHKQIRAKNNKIFDVRSCCMEDIDELQSFFRRGASESTHTLLCKKHEPSSSRLQTKVLNALNNPLEIYLCVIDKQKIIAQMHLKALSSDHPWIQHIAEFGMMVLKEYWNLGIGTALLEIMQEFCKGIGISKIEAKVRVSNKRGLTLYQKQGYVIEGTRKNAAFINRKFEDEYFIAKFIEPIQPK